MRTMFFDKCEKKTIDGHTYEISNGSNVDMFNCKTNLYEMCNYMQDPYDERDFNSWQVWKKDLIKILKEWDKLYAKHSKSVWPEMSQIHLTCMKPLTQLIDANNNFYKLEEMIKGKYEVDEFRYQALETEFSKFFTGICEILKEFGDLKNHFNIP